MKHGLIYLKDRQRDIEKQLNMLYSEYYRLLKEAGLNPPKITTPSFNERVDGGVKPIPMYVAYETNKQEIAKLINNYTELTDTIIELEKQHRENDQLIKNYNESLENSESIEYKMLKLRLKHGKRMSYRKIGQIYGYSESQTRRIIVKLMNVNENE